MTSTVMTVYGSTLTTYRIAAANFDVLLEEIARVNKRARKHDLEEISIHKIGTEMEDAVSQSGQKYQRAITLFTVNVPRVCIDGWSLVAAIDPVGDSNVLRTVPGRECPERFRTADLHCDHCRTNRRRANVFVLGHTDGRYVQVGRNCCKDFIGHDVSSMLAHAEISHDLCEVLEESEREGGRYGHGRESFGIDLQAYVGTVAVIVRKVGWTPRRIDDVNNTASIAWRIESDPKNSRELVARYELQPTEEDQQTANDAIEWARSLTGTGSNFLENLRVVCSQDRVIYGHAGICAAVIVAYQRHREQEIKRARLRERSAGASHVGEIKKRATFRNLTVELVKSFDSIYGVRCLVRLADKSGNVLIWWASGHPKFGQGDEIDCKATVKAHSDYQGVPQTEIQRLTLIEKRKVLEPMAR